MNGAQVVRALAPGSPRLLKFSPSQARIRSGPNAGEFAGSAGGVAGHVTAAHPLMGGYGQHGALPDHATLETGRLHRHGKHGSTIVPGGAVVKQGDVEKFNPSQARIRSGPNAGEFAGGGGGDIVDRHVASAHGGYGDPHIAAHRADDAQARRIHTLQVSTVTPHFHEQDGGIVFKEPAKAKTGPTKWMQGHMSTAHPSGREIGVHEHNGQTTSHVHHHVSGEVVREHDSSRTSVPGAGRAGQLARQEAARRPDVESAPPRGWSMGWSDPGLTRGLGVLHREQAQRVSLGNQNFVDSARRSQASKVLKEHGRVNIEGKTSAMSVTSGDDMGGAFVHRTGQPVSDGYHSPSVSRAVTEAMEFAVGKKPIELYRARSH